MFKWLLDSLIATARSGARARNMALLGARREVLVEREARRGEAMMARTRDFKSVLVPLESARPGEYLQVELTGTTGSTFTGSPVRERAALPLAG